MFAKVGGFGGRRKDRNKKAKKAEKREETVRRHLLTKGRKERGGEMWALLPDYWVWGNDNKMATHQPVIHLCETGNFTRKIGEIRFFTFVYFMSWKVLLLLNQMIKTTTVPQVRELHPNYFKHQSSITLNEIKHPNDTSAYPGRMSWGMISLARSSHGSLKQTWDRRRLQNTKRESLFINRMLDITHHWLQASQTMYQSLILFF